MAQFFTKDYIILWTLLLAVALFFPVRQLIWVLFVRRVQSKLGDVDETERMRLKTRAGVTSALVCLLFSYFYAVKLFTS